MTKREREENRLPRLTAYATAEGYRLKLLQAFLKREHGVVTVRVFDDCVYAVYQLPLLPGYGAGTKVRSSPVSKSPGGVSLLERMTLAEDMGYDDEYFPSTNPDDPVVNSTNPSEYILSHSPPTMGHEDMMTNLDIPAGHAEEREQEIEAVQESLEAGDGLDEGALGLIAEEGVGVRTAIENEHEQHHHEGQESSAASSSSQPSTHGPIGTHMDPKHPGYLEHIPATALSPQDLTPVSETSAVPSVPAIARLKGRRKSAAHLSGRIGEAVFFEYGVSVFFGFQEADERDIMEDCEGGGCWSRSLSEEDWEQEDFHYTVRASRPCWLPVLIAV
jgi:uncharacterized Rmd1/YagE family protein